MSYSFYKSLTKDIEKHNLHLLKLSNFMGLFKIPVHALNALGCIHCIHHYGKLIVMHRQYKNIINLTDNQKKVKLHHAMKP